MAIFEPIFGSEDRRWGGFFDLRGRRKKMGCFSIFGAEDRVRIEDRGGRFYDLPASKIVDGGFLRSFGSEDRRAPPCAAPTRPARGMSGF